MNIMAEYGFRRTLIVTDAMLIKLGMANDIQKALQERDIFSVILMVRILTQLPATLRLA